MYRKSLQAEIESLQQKFQKACQDINEEKSLHIRAESRIQGLETELQAHTDDVAVLQSQIVDYRNLGDERTRQVSTRIYNGLYTYGDDYLYTSSYMTELVNVCVSLYMMELLLLLLLLLLLCPLLGDRMEMIIHVTV